MSNIDKRAQMELYAKVEQQAHKLRGNPIAYQVVTGMCPVNVIEMHAKKILALLDELEAKDKRIAEHGEIIANQERWIKAVEETIITTTDRAEVAEKRIAEQRETLLAARSYVMQCARMGDAHANGVLQAMDRATGKGEAS